jgi:hypothetical protein
MADLIRLRLTCLVGLALAITVSAQSDNSQISGFVKDQSGGVIAGAKVVVRNERGFERVATTNNEGYYIATSVPPGIGSQPGRRRLRPQPTQGQ